MTDDAEQDDDRPPLRVTPMEGADILVTYLTRRREMLIVELRIIEDLLALPTSVPKRTR